MPTTSTAMNSQGKRPPVLPVLLAALLHRSLAHSQWVMATSPSRES